MVTVDFCSWRSAKRLWFIVISAAWLEWSVCLIVFLSRTSARCIIFLFAMTLLAYPSRLFNSGRNGVFCPHRDEEEEDRPVNPVAVHLRSFWGGGAWRVGGVWLNVIPLAECDTVGICINLWKLTLCNKCEKPSMGVTFPLNFPLQTHSMLSCLALARLLSPRRSWFDDYFWVYTSLFFFFSFFFFFVFLLHNTKIQFVNSISSIFVVTLDTQILYIWYFRSVRWRLIRRSTGEGW